MINEEKVYDALRTVIDPEVGFDIVSLGLIYDVKVSVNDVKVDMTLSTKGCPLHELLQQWAKDSILELDGVGNVELNLVWEPAWDISMASDEVKKALS